LQDQYNKKGKFKKWKGNNENSKNSNEGNSKKLRFNSAR
jgi:hypothetical protein